MDRKMDNKQVFAQNLKDLREKIGISQRTLAKKLGVQPTDVSSYERGVKLPTVKKLIKIADFFDVSVDKLLGREWRSEKVDLLTAVKVLLADYGFEWDGGNRCFLSADRNVYALVNEFMQLRELVKGGQIKADVLELWLEDKRKKMEKGTIAKMP